jgi:LysM repeat protein
MSDMRRLLEAMDSMSRAEKKPTGPQFPGYLKGTDPASKTRSKMVGGGCEQESVMTELAATAKKKSAEWALEEEFKQFKEAELPQGQFGRQFGNWSTQPAVDTSLPSGYGTPLPKLPDPKGDQSGGFKKVLPGEPFDPNQRSLPGVSTPPSAGDPGLGVKLPTDTFNRPNAQGIRPPYQNRDKETNGPVELPPLAPLPSVTPSNTEKFDPAKNKGTNTEKFDPISIKIDPQTGKTTELDKLPPITNPQYAKDMQPARAGQSGQGIKAPREYIPIDKEKPVQPPALGIRPTSKTQLGDKTAISPAEMDNINQQIQQQQKTQQNKLPPAVEPKSDSTGSSTLRDKLNKASDTSDNSPVKPGTTTPTQTASAPKPGSWQEIAQRNNISDPTKLRVGQPIELPDGSSYTVDKGDTLGGIANALRTTGMPPGQIQKPAAPTTPKSTPAQEIPRGRPTPDSERNQTPPAKSAPPEPVPKPVTPAPDIKAPSASVYGPDKQKTDQEKSDRLKELDKRRSEQNQSAPSRHPLKPSINVPQSSTSAPQPAPDISSQAGQDAQWEKDKERMKGWLPDWVKGKSDNKPTAPASTSLNDTRRQADIAALQREISRTPAREKTRLGILNKELADRQQVATNETLSQKLAKDFEQFLESDEPYQGYDQDVEKLKQRARLGPMKTVWDEKTQRYRVVPVKPQEKQIKEYGNTQNADTQATNADTQQTSHAVDPSNPDAMAQKVDIATAKSTMSGLKNILGPQLNTNAAASGIVNMNDGKPLSVPEREAISTLTPLVTKAAENPATAGALKSALSTAGMLAKQGK